MPDRTSMDPEAWQKLGLRTIQSAKLRSDTITIDPAMLERFGIHATMHGTANVTVDLGAGLDTAKITADIKNLHGGKITMPIDGHFEAMLEGRPAKAQFAIKTAKSALMTIVVDAKLPKTVEELREDPLAVREGPLDATIELKRHVRTGPARGVRPRPDHGRHDDRQDRRHRHDRLADRQGPRGREQPGVAAGLARPPHPDGQAARARRDLRRPRRQGHDRRRGGLGRQAERHRRAQPEAPLRLEREADREASSISHRCSRSPPIRAARRRARSTRTSTINGFDVRTSQIAGELHIRQARIPIAPIVGTLRKADINIAITNKEIKVNAAGKLGKGDITAERARSPLNGVDLDGGTFKVVLHKCRRSARSSRSIDSHDHRQDGPQGREVDRGHHRRQDVRDRSTRPRARR